MSLPYPFAFWVITEQKSNEVGRLLAEFNLHPRPCSLYGLFLCIKEMLISQPPNQPWTTYKLVCS